MDDIKSVRKTEKNWKHSKNAQKDEKESVHTMWMSLLKIDSGTDTSVISEATYETLQYEPKLCEKKIFNVQTALWPQKSSF